MEEFTFGPAQPGDGVDIARLFALVQGSQTLGLTIWSSPLAGAFVEDIIAGEEPRLGMKYYKVTAGSQMEGALCSRNTDGRLFIDNVYVSPGLRRMQMAARFILHSTRSCVKDFECQEVAWDVWSHKRALVLWYRQLGGVEQYRKNWFALRVPQNPGPAGSVLGREKAERKHARYGFSTVDVVTSQGRYGCGLIGTHAFRITDDRSVADPAFLPALATIDPDRVVYVFSGKPDLPGAGSAVATAIRMHAPLGRFCRQLEQHIPSCMAVR